MTDPGEQWWSWKAWRSAIEARPWLAALIAIDVLLVGAVLGGASRDHIVPIGTLLAGSLAAFVALGQLSVARQRHEKQTDADTQRRITETFSKAVEQLGSDKLQVRLGGIYTLERVSRESKADYWPVMEMLTAFIRERTRSEKEEDALLLSGTIQTSENSQLEKTIKPPTDVEAALTVMSRRSDEGRKREYEAKWRLDLSYCILKGASLSSANFGRVNLMGAQLQGADLTFAHLEGAFLIEAHLQEARCIGAHLKGAILTEAHLEDASFHKADLKRSILSRTHLEGCDFVGADFEGAYLLDAYLIGADFSRARLNGASLHRSVLTNAYFEGADFTGTHLEAVDLSNALGLEQSQLDSAHGDERTIIPIKLERPTQWTPQKERQDNGPISH